MGLFYPYMSGSYLDAMTGQQKHEFVTTAKACGFGGIYVNTMALRDYAAMEFGNFEYGKSVVQSHKDFVSRAKDAGHRVIWGSWIRPGGSGVQLDEAQRYMNGKQIVADCRTAVNYAQEIGADEDSGDGEPYGAHPCRAYKKYDIPNPEFECMADIYAQVASVVQMGIWMPVGSQQAQRGNWIASQIGKRHMRWYNARLKCGRYRNLTNGQPMNPDVLPTDAANGFEFKEKPNPMFGYFVTPGGAAVGKSVTWTPEQLRDEVFGDHPDDLLFYYDYTTADPIELMKRAAA